MNTAPNLTDQQLLRYSRHILLPQIGIAGQQRLMQSRVLIVGVGGLGSPVALYLAAAGVGTLLLADADTVELSNLQRQIIHDTALLGQTKVASAQQRLAVINPEVCVELIPHQLDVAALLTVVPSVHLVIDASDNFNTRFAINRACYAAVVPCVSGAAIGFTGQIIAFSGQPGGPCYHCLYPEHSAGDEQHTACTASGVFAPLVGVIGSLQANEALKLLLGIDAPRYGRLLLFDALQCDWRTVQLTADAHCPICQH